MIELINYVTVLFALSTFALGIDILWHVRGGVFARALLPFVISWFLSSLVALVELIDTTPRGELYSDVLRMFRLSMSLLGAYFLWKIVNPRTQVMRFKKS